MPRAWPLPAKFPCWVKAVYSWSGETKQDLGFVEGDLIECLNAGDGQWWFGRLKRNHTMGLFPSNFVEILEAHATDRSKTPSPKPHLPSSAPNLNHSYVPPTPTTPQAPAPPPHRVSYATPAHDESRPRSRSPLPDRTPTPVRSAMEDVMYSLDNMSVIDSPDIDSYYSAAAIDADAEHPLARNHSRRRPKSSMGFQHNPNAGFDHLLPDYPEEERPPALLTYGDRLAERIRRMETHRQPQPPTHVQIPSQQPRPGSMRRHRPFLSRTLTLNSNSTAAGSNASGGTLFSNQTTLTALSSVSGVSATSAGSMARRKGCTTEGMGSSLHALDLSTLNARGGIATLKSKKSGFFKRLLGGGKSLDEANQTKTTPTDWTRARRDVHRVNSLSQLEIQQRWEKNVVDGFIVIAPNNVIMELVQGDEHADGGAVDDPIDVGAANFTQVDKAIRFMATVPAGVGPSHFAAGYLCRPYRNDLQCARAIFTFMAEKMSWDGPSSVPRDVDGLDTHLANILQCKRGSPEEIAWCIKRMCDGVSIECEVVHGYLKSPGEVIDLEVSPKANHVWNAVLVDSEWRIMDASLASPTNPRRALYSTHQGIDHFYFLTKPSQAAYTHVPNHAAQQHLVPPTTREVLLALPYACPPFFANRLQMYNFNTSLTRMDGLEATQIDILVPQDVECVAEIETGAIAIDADGNLFNMSNSRRTPALAQALWDGDSRFYRIKALLPPGETQGALKIYAGKKGFMHSIKDNPHPLSLALPLFHTGNNESFSFVTRHPCPHAQRHDLYVAQPQCGQLAVNNTYIFSFRQHASTASALSSRPAKLAVQAPSGKITRTRLSEENGNWDMVTKVQESGVWRALVLADRSARWCVFAEWTCV